MPPPPLAPSPPARHHGATRLELAITLTLIGVFAVVTLQRIWAFNRLAEPLAVEQMVGTARSALAIEVARRALDEGLGPVAELEGSNPLRLMERIPFTYEGELRDVDPATIPGFRWYFDLDRQLLVYRVGNGERLISSLQGPPRIRFRVIASYDDTNANGRFDGDENLYGLDLQPVEPFAWRPLEQGQ